MNLETIVAPMTPHGVSAVAAIRVSGPHVRDVIFTLFGEKAIKSLKSHVAKLGFARTIQKNNSPSEIIDSLLYIFFEGPKSYTGEDVLELYPHGNPLIVRELIQTIRSINGVRLANPGEYTRRAFLNGKMDLAQAESVADVIHSANKSELRNAHRLLNGELSKKVTLLNSQIKDISARLELDVDFAEEEADPDFEKWETKILSIRKSVESILKSFKGSAAVRHLPLVVLYGAPNAGKSSLANALLGEDRILVSNIPGTTRDFVEIRLFLNNGEIRMVDTAGIAQKSIDTLDALSMKKSREILQEADFKILVIDSQKNEFICNESIKTLGFTPDLLLYSKCDLLNINHNNSDIEIDSSNKIKVLNVSAKTGKGLQELTNILNDNLFKNKNETEDFWITSEREKVCLENALEGIDKALELIHINPAVELIAFEMQLVRRFLESIVGEISSEDILQSIFAGFCIGK